MDKLRNGNAPNVGNDKETNTDTSKDSEKDKNKDSDKKKKDYKYNTNSKANVGASNYNYEGIHLTKNPRMSYFEAKTKYATSSDGRNMAKVISGVQDGLDVLPPSFHNALMYNHRKAIFDKLRENSSAGTRMLRSVFTEQRSNVGSSSTKDDTGYFRLGSCVFRIPPEFITVSSVSNNNAIPTLRSSSSLITKSAYVTREIMVNLVLNGMNQINGYEVESPFGYPHYVDGLRALLGQFKFTPFVPVENVFLNIQHNIHAVALKNITVETVEDFPETLLVRLTLNEFNSTPYTNAPNYAFDESINWDLFNFYIQRNIRDKEIGLKRIQTDHLDDRVVFKLLKPSVLKTASGDDLEKYDKNKAVYTKVNLLDDKNYDIAVDTKKDGLKMTKFTFATGNKLPKIQLSYYETPTFQFLGGTDTEFVMQFETTNEAAVAELNLMNSSNLEMVRENKHKTGIGFIKVENDLLNLTGTYHIVIGNITSSTVPGFPGMYTITVSGMGFDCGQKDREKFKAFRPFYGKDNKKGEGWFAGRKGTRADLITQTKRGLANKVVQESAVEAKLMCTELYPDLRLPKYSAIDWALSQIIKWRKSKGLSTDGIPNKYPRPKSYIAGKGGERTEYNGFVDPDFYMTYPFQIGSMKVIDTKEKTLKSNYKKVAKSLFGTRSAEFNPEVRSLKDVRATTVSKLMDDSINPVSTLFLSEPTVDPVKEPEYVPGYEPDAQLRFHKGNLEVNNSDEELIEKLNSWVKVSVTGTVSGGGGGGGNYDSMADGQPGDNTKNPKQVKKVTGNPFVDLLINRASVKCGYVYGATQKGDICTQDYINSRRRQYPNIGGWGSASQWIGRQVFDCSSFVCYGLIRVGNRPASYRVNSSSWGRANNCTPISRSEAKVGDVFYGGGHIAVYIGDNKVVNASCHEKGCIIGSASVWNKGSKCRQTSRINGLEEDCRKFLQANPDFYINDNASSSSSTSNSNKKDSKSNGVINNDFVTNAAVKDTKNPSSNTSSNSGDSFTSGAPVLGKFGSDPMFVQQLNSSKREKSSKDRFVGTKADRYDDLIIKYCKPYNMDPNFIKTIMMIESGGDPRCYNGMPSQPCMGLLQVHQKYFPLPNPYDPNQNIKKGCEVLYGYGAYKNPNVAFDKKKWIACFNRGPGNLKKQLAGKSPEPVETLNYYRKFDVFYARLVKSGGKPGSSVTALDNGKVPPASWYEGIGGAGGSSGGTQTVDIDAKVWFELPERSNVNINADELKNKFKDALHSTAKVAMNILSFGTVGGGTVLVKGEGAEAIEKPKSKPKAKNSVQSRSIAVDESKVVRDGYIHAKDYKPTVKKAAFKSPQDNIMNSEIPTQAEFGIGEIDSLSDGELNFHRNKVSKIKDFRNDGDNMERMFVDVGTYGFKGRLTRAFPSYMFLIIDEHMGWVDNKRFWSNYYLYQSALEIDVHEAYDSPIATAKVTLSNVHRNIREFNKGPSLTDQILGEDSDYAWYNKLSYRWFGSIIDEEITDSMLEMRNELWPEIFIREGLRIHIRLGYGSNPANYAPTFSGVITEVMDGGELVTIAAQSDGAELVSTSVTDRTNGTNVDVGLPEEPSDIIAALLCNRENEFLYSLTNGQFFIDNTYGIMHFGFYSSGHKEGSILIDSDNGAVTGISGGTGLVAGGLIGGLPGAVASGALGTIGGSLLRRDRFEYDIVKNIYKGTYDGEYIYDPSFFNFDGETNMRFFAFNRTPWDIMKMCEKMMPEFVCYPRPYGLEYRIFYGLPWWQHKYRYERDDANNKVYELSKTFAQVNPLDSFSDIIDNRIRVDTTSLATNMIGVYTLGGDLASTPVIMSDIYIDRDKQVTRTIDTTSVQDFKGIPSIVDKALEWSGLFDNGKHNAIRVCISELIDSWKKTYAGELIVIGAPEVRCHNYMYLNDSYAKMTGVCHIREVVHSLSGDRGYVSTVIPGLVATNALKNGGSNAVMKSILHAGGIYYAYKKVGGLQAIAQNAIGPAMAGSKFGSSVLNYGGKAVGFLKGKGLNILAWSREGKIVSKMGSILNIAKEAIAGSASGSAVMGNISSILGGLGITAAGAASVVAIGLEITGAFIIGALINKLITSITDMFKYNNCINVFPMYIEDRPLIGGSTGQRDLYPREDKK